MQLYWAFFPQAFPQLKASILLKELYETLIIWLDSILGLQTVIGYAKDFILYCLGQSFFIY